MPDGLFSGSTPPKPTPPPIRSAYDTPPMVIPSADPRGTNFRSSGADPLTVLGGADANSVKKIATLFVVGNPAGLVKPGNLDLNTRPQVKNPDGSISTVRSITIDQDGKAILLPTVIGNRVVSARDAVNHYRKTGENLGVFENSDAADAYANALHEQQAQMIEGK